MVMLSVSGISAPHPVFLSPWLIYLHENHIIGHPSKEWTFLNSIYKEHTWFHFIYIFSLSTYVILQTCLICSWKTRLRVETIQFPFVQAKVQCETCCFIFYQFSQHIECVQFFVFLPIILLFKLNQFCKRDFWNVFKFILIRYCYLLKYVLRLEYYLYFILLWPITFCWEVVVIC